MKKDIFDSNNQHHLRTSISKYSNDDGKYSDQNSSINEPEVYKSKVKIQNEEIINVRSAAKELYKKYVELYDSVPIGLFTFDSEWNIHNVNIAGAAILGKEKSDIINKSFKLFIDYHSFPDFNNFCNTVNDSEAGQSCKIMLSVSCKPCCVQIISMPPSCSSGKNVIQTAVIDVTAQMETEDKLRHAYKMECIGKITSDISHDFNKILSAIVVYSSLLRNKLEDGSPLKEYANQIVSSSETAASLIQNLLLFAKKPLMNTIPTDLNGIIRESKMVLSTILGENIELLISLSEESIIINASTTQIKQILCNLCSNSTDAMPDGGVFYISTEKTTIDEKFIQRNGFGKIGEYALLTVSDIGSGIDEETQKNIFVPFFTTKEEKIGTGLGLSIVYGLVKNHNGYIVCDSAQGRGTIFEIFFPLYGTNVRLNPK
ncbi:MAG: hypothetical protein HZA77_16180 [Candidatus Schekmanbacteria bacterium]|nr:hypothetical protein [Candidatus Schekmanbacteria bacterium]